LNHVTPQGRRATNRENKIQRPYWQISVWAIQIHTSHPQKDILSMAKKGINMMAVRNFGKVLLIPYLVAGMLFVFGCAGTMSLEEAKNVSLEMSVTSFTPPPRRINDILSVLQTEGQFDKRIADHFQEALKKQPPETDDDATLARFYHERGFAAIEAGLQCEALADLRKAFSHAEKASSITNNLLFRLGKVERECGSITHSIELLERAAKKGHRSSASGLTFAYLRVGDIASAIKAKDRVVELSESRGERSGRALTLQETTWQRFNPAEAGAAILSAQGKYQEAEKLCRTGIAERPYIIATNPSAILHLRNDLAFNLADQGRFMEAELEARGVIQESMGLAGKAGDVTANAVGALASIMLQQGRREEAEKLARSRIKIVETSGMTEDTRYSAAAHISLADILVRRGKYTDAAYEYDFVRDSLKENKSLYDNNYSRNRNLILTLIKTGRTEEAMKLIEPAREAALKYFGEKSFADAELVGLRGMARLRGKQYVEALSDFKQAIPVLMTRKDLGFRGRNILEVYLDLLSRIQGTPLEQTTEDNAASKAFYVAGLLGGHTVERALGEGNARAAAAYDPDLADIVRKEQDMRKQATALETTLSTVMALPTDQQSPEGVRQLKENIATLARAGAVLQEEISRRFPKYAEFVKPRPVSAPDIQKVLRFGEALMSIYTIDDKTFVWAIPRQGKILFHAAPLGRKDLEKMVADLRKPLDANPTRFGDIPDFDTTLAYRLYTELLKPVAEGWKDASDLIVVASGPLGQIPFSLLTTEPVKPEVEKNLLFSHYRSVPWLIRKVSITTVPTVSSLLSLRTIPAGDPKRKAFIGFGDPVFNRKQLAPIPSQAASAAVFQKEEQGMIPIIASRGMKVQVRGIRISEKGNLDKQEIITSRLSQLQRLPDTAEEIKSIARILNADVAQDIFLNKEASEHRIKTMDLADRKIIAFATHALVPGDLDGLDQPALALSSPEVTGEKEDGLLTMDEILKLKLNADWVILSACNTGASNGAGQEAVSGLGRAFFYAGTRSLLVSLWPVETTSATKLVTGIFEAQKKDASLSHSQALRKSMVHLLDNERFVDPATGKIVASYAHPIFWAPFNIVGETGKQ
jgi:CHAT domain-containing protein